MKVMVIVKATKASEAGVMPDEKLLADMGNYNEQLSKAGILISMEGLHPSSKGVRVRFSGTNRVVTDGPFTETNELIAGYWLWRVSSMAEAIDWVKRCPNPMTIDSDIEIREVFEADNFGEVFTPELREQEAAVRAQTLGLGPVKFENGRELLIAGLKQSYMFVSRDSIPSQWQRFLPHLSEIPGRIGDSSFGVCSSYRQDHGFDYMSGVEVSESVALPNGLTTLRIPAARYAVFNHCENVSTIAKTIDTICQQWLPESGLKPEAAPCIEHYRGDFNTKTGTGGIEIWIPIQKSGNEKASK